MPAAYGHRRCIPVHGGSNPTACQHHPRVGKARLLTRLLTSRVVTGVRHVQASAQLASGMELDEAEADHGNAEADGGSV